jgi:hypothetical protein
MNATITKSAKERFEDLIRNAPEFFSEDFTLTDEAEYEQVLAHIEEHKYLTNENIPYEISMREALFSWYENVYEPLMIAIDREAVLGAFPGKSRGDLFMWICHHWHLLKQDKNRDVGAEEAVRSFGAKFGNGALTRFIYKLKLTAA